MSETGSAIAGDNSGMTLLEVLVAIAIMALITALVFPDLIRMRDALLVRGAVLRLAADLRQAHADAIDGAMDMAVTGLRGNQSYRGADGLHPLPPGVRLSTGTIIFHADGTASGDGFVLTAGSRQTAQVVVDPVLGTTAVEGL